MTQDSREPQTPLLSLIIPTRDRPLQLRRCLTSLLEQTYARGLWEVIVVVDGEDDPVRDELRGWTERLPLRWSQQPHAGCGAARNTGAADARGRYLVFTDDDCVFPPEWLSRYAECFQSAHDCIVAGRSMNALTVNPYSQATQDLMDYMLSHFNSSHADATLAIGNNFGVPAEGFRALDGFSLRYFRAAAEDRDFCARWREAGRRIVYAPDIVVHHAHELTLASFFRQHMHYGRGAWLFHSSRSRWKSRPRVETLGFYFSMFRASSSPRSLVLLLISQMAQTVGYAAGWLQGALRIRA